MAENEFQEEKRTRLATITIDRCEGMTSLSYSGAVEEFAAFEGFAGCRARSLASVLLGMAEQMDPEGFEAAGLERTAEMNRLRGMIGLYQQAVNTMAEIPARFTK
jgi:hypothetical protein